MSIFERGQARRRRPNKYIFKKSGKSPCRYIFHLPNYVPYSNGIKTLWYTAFLFSREKSVKIKNYHAGELKEYDVPDRYEKLIDHDVTITDNDIVIYPDMVIGNPLGANKVVRYLMAKDYILNGHATEYGQHDYLMAYSKAVDHKLPQYMVLLPELLNLKKYQQAKTKTLLIYYGKCRISLEPKKIREICQDFDEVKIITRLHPSEKEILYEEVAKAALLISFDPLTALNYEANLVGTPVLLLDDVFQNTFEHFNHALPGFFYDYQDLKSQDLQEVGREVFDLAHDDLAVMLSREHLSTTTTINHIDRWFDKNQRNDSGYKARSLHFYWRDWESSPLFSCTTLKSVIAYNLARKNRVYYAAGLLLSRSIASVKSFKRAILNRLGGSLFTPSELEILRYKKHPTTSHAQADVGTEETSGNEIKPNDDSKINDIIVLGNDHTSKIWRATCL